jgi:hypothetical protein
MLRSSARALWQRVEPALHGLWRLAEHELNACEGHLLALQEHWRVARRARRTAELVRDQFDLLPATHSRLANDHRQRVKLLRQLWSGADLTA